MSGSGGDAAGAGQYAGSNAEGGQGNSDINGHHHHHGSSRRDRSNDSRGSSQDRRYDGSQRRRGMNSRKDIGSMGGGSATGGPGAGSSGRGGPQQSGSAYRRGGKRAGLEQKSNGFYYPPMSKPLVSFQQFSSI